MSSSPDRRGAPVRYEVKIEAVGGQEYCYRITTWLHAEKAVALASAAHEKAHPWRDDHLAALFDVHVQELGEPDRTPQGLFSIHDGDLGDRNEW